MRTNFFLLFFLLLSCYAIGRETNKIVIFNDTLYQIDYTHTELKGIVTLYPLVTADYYYILSKKLTYNYLKKLFVRYGIKYSNYQLKFTSDSLVIGISEFLILKINSSSNLLQKEIEFSYNKRSSLKLKFIGEYGEPGQEKKYINTNLLVESLALTLDSCYVATGIALHPSKRHTSITITNTIIESYLTSPFNIVSMENGKAKPTPEQKIVKLSITKSTLMNFHLSSETFTDSVIIEHCNFWKSVNMDQKVSFDNCEFRNYFSLISTKVNTKDLVKNTSTIEQNLSKYFGSDWNFGGYIFLMTCTFKNKAIIAGCFTAEVSNCFFSDDLYFIANGDSALLANSEITGNFYSEYSTIQKSNFYNSIFHKNLDFNLFLEVPYENEPKLVIFAGPFYFNQKTKHFDNANFVGNATFILNDRYEGYFDIPLTKVNTFNIRHDAYPQNFYSDRLFNFLSYPIPSNKIQFESFDDFYKHLLLKLNLSEKAFVNDDEYKSAIQAIEYQRLQQRINYYFFNPSITNTPRFLWRMLCQVVVRNGYNGEGRFILSNLFLILLFLFLFTRYNKQIVDHYKTNASADLYDAYYQKRNFLQKRIIILKYILTLYIAIRFHFSYFSKNSKFFKACFTIWLAGKIMLLIFLIFIVPQYKFFQSLFG